MSNPPPAGPSRSKRQRVVSNPTTFDDDPMSGDAAISGDSRPDTPSEAEPDPIPTTPFRRGSFKKFYSGPIDWVAEMAAEKLRSNPPGSPAARRKLAWDVPQTPTPRPAQRQPFAPAVPTTATATDPQIEVDRTARVVSSLIADLTRVTPGGSPSLTPPLRSLINTFFSAIPMDLLAEAIATNVTLMEIITPHQAPPPPPPVPAPAKGGKGKKRAPAPAPSKGRSGAPAAPSTTPLPSAAKPKKPTFAEAAKSASTSTPGSNPPKFNPSPKVASPMRSKARDPLSAAFKPLTPIAPEAQASGIAVVEHINRLLAPSHFQLKGCAWSPFGNFIATPHLSEDVAKLPEVLPRILLDMFKVEFRHLTFDNSSFVVVYNLPLGPPSNWADPSTIASALMAQNNILEPLPASPGRWLANPDRHKGTTASLRLSLSPLMKAAILRSGMLFFDGRPHPVRAFTAAKTKPNQCRQCWRLGHSEAWCRQTNPVCGTCTQGHPSHHHHAVAPNAAQLCVLCKGAHPSWTRWCVNRHIQLAAQPPLPKKKPAKPSAASKRHASKVTAGSSTKVSSSTTEPSGDVVTHL
ncbi:hypothetical protein BOTBODRAFT_173508 [Botryobasidium botryosum FD-172 SS1]|uniref:Uncharacterized protein n=1 Tax=Botryobasidium botryosum (strain FD-172 SS1) TaxID=930990 RepID=A0A067MJZ2_BOTB1|nr:hypothetical protein BOTBODRAFT_173508 [Botryobasidium botryosum FD-172 SS1]